MRIKLPVTEVDKMLVDVDSFMVQGKTRRRRRIICMNDVMGWLMMKCFFEDTVSFKDTAIQRTQVESGL